MKAVTVLCALCALCAALAPAAASDALPPPWRGDAQTTFFDWEFNTPETRFTPEVVANPYGAPDIQVIDPENWYYTYSNWNMVGMWSMDGEKSRIEITVPVQPAAEPAVKDIWVQMVYLRQHDPGVRVAAGVLVDREDVFVNTGPGYDWWLMRTHWQVPSSSQVDLIIIDSTPHGQDWAIDRVIIDTRYEVVPEPSSALILLSGIAATLGALRKRAVA